MLLKLNDIGRLNLVHHHNNGNNNENPRQVWSLWNGARCVERSVQNSSSTDNESADAVMQVLHDPQRNHWGNVLVRLYREIQCSLNFEHAINDIPLATFQMVSLSVRRRCWECTVAECGHFEHIRTQGSLRNRTQYIFYTSSFFYILLNLFFPTSCSPPSYSIFQCLSWYLSSIHAFNVAMPSYFTIFYFIQLQNFSYFMLCIPSLLVFPSMLLKNFSSVLWILLESFFVIVHVLAP